MEAWFFYLQMCKYLEIRKVFIPDIMGKHNLSLNSKRLVKGKTRLNFLKISWQW